MRRNGHVNIVVILLLALTTTLSVGTLLRAYNTETAWVNIFAQQTRYIANLETELGWSDKVNEANLDSVRWDSISADNILRREMGTMGDDILEYARDSDLETYEMAKILNNTNVVILNTLADIKAAQPEPWAATHQQMQDATVWIVRLHDKCPDDAPCREYEMRSGQQLGEVCSWGSGVFIGDNKIMTAHHVVNSVNLMDGRWAVNYQGVQYAILGMHLDPDSDLATIDTEEIPELFIPELLGRDIRLGETVVIVGTPHIGVEPDALHLRMTQGIVSHLDRGDDTKQFHGWSVLIGTDASSGPGNSGGPVFINGRLAALLVGGWGGEISNMGLILPVSEYN